VTQKYFEKKSYTILCRFTKLFYKEPIIFKTPTSPALQVSLSQPQIFVSTD